MIYIIFGIFIFIWIVVIYLSLGDNIDKKEIKLDYKNTDFFDELKKINIENDKISQVKKEIWNYIVWMDNLINSILVSILSNDHILVEWVPWLAKTRTILVFSKVLWLDFKRIQFTPDMLPSDIIGGEIYNKNTWKFEIFKWPVFTNLLLADEINRATPKVQSALLEAMQERKVTIWNTTFDLEKPFFVMATQNPLEQEWTFPLPEAQLDRFLFKTVVSYPTKEEEIKVLDSFDKDLDEINTLLNKQDLLEMQEKIKNTEIPTDAKRYIVDLVNITRWESKYIEVWASTRAVIALSKAGKVVAYLQWKDQVDIDDIKKIALLVLRHRVKLSYQAVVENRRVDEILIEEFIKIKDI